MSPGALPSGGVWFSSWYVISVDTGHIAQSPQSSPTWSPAFKMEPVLSVSSFRVRKEDVMMIKEETDRTGSALKAGVHLGPDCGV